ncbi:MAG TPA: class I SAM-dependent methyltransferase, partial [Thermoplasmata archaeon]|nr:class I SAM-dependent methyltransferase [Thermoplasmata archaeon]
MPAADGPTASDGSPLPERGRPTYERDVRAMFAHIARGYEGFDHLASVGQDYLWRPRALWDLDRFRAGAPAVGWVLDLGCGTGELTRLTLRHYRGCRVVGADFTPEMLRRAAAALPPKDRDRAPLVRATARRLPFRDGRFDLVVSGFVARNLPDLAGALGEIRRVLAPGGSAMVLDITGPSDPFFRKMFLAYFDTVVPMLGAAVGSRGPYTYLP